MWSAGERKDSIDELESAGLEVLVHNIIRDPDEERRRMRLNPVVAHLVERELERGDHPYFEDRFAPVREQCHSGPSAIFKRSAHVRSSLEEYT